MLPTETGTWKVLPPSKSMPSWKPLPQKLSSATTRMTPATEYQILRLPTTSMPASPRYSRAARLLMLLISGLLDPGRGGLLVGLRVLQHATQAAHARREE